MRSGPPLPDRQETLGERLRRLRSERGLTLRDLARAGVSAAHISRIETGNRQPSIHTIRLLAHGLGVSPEHLESGGQLSSREELELALADAELALRLTPEERRLEHDLRSLVQRAAEQADSDVAAKARAVLGMALFNWGRLREAADELETALVHDVMQPGVVPDAYAVLTKVYDGLGRRRDAVGVCERALAATHEDDDVHRILFTTYLSHALTELGDFDRAGALLEELRPRIDRYDPQSLARLHWSLAHVATAQENRRLALRHMSAAIRQLKGTEDTERLARAHMMCAEIRLWSGSTTGVADHLRAARKLLPAFADAVSHGELRGLEALNAARHGRHDDARAAAKESLASLAHHHAPRAPALYAFALSEAAAGRFAYADQLFASVLELRLELKLWREAAAIARDRAEARTAADDRDGAAFWEARAKQLERRATARPQPRV